MSVWFLSHWYLLAGVAIGLVGVVVLWRSIGLPRTEGSRSLSSYLLVWPLIFEQERGAKTKTRRTFVVIGILIMLLLITVGFIVNPGRG
jgi:hypothetical protein